MSEAPVHELQAVPISRGRGAAAGWPSVMRAVPDLMLVVAREGTIRYASPSSSWLLGRMPTQLVNRHSCELVSPNDRRNWLAWLAHAESGGQTPDLVHRLLRADGTTAWFETRMRRAKSAIDREGDVVVISRDVSGRPQSDEHRTAASVMWGEVCDLIRVGVIVLDGASVVVAANRRAEELLAARRGVLPGADLASCLAPVGPDGTCGSQELLIGGGFVRPQLAVGLCSPGGRRHYVRVYASALPRPTDLAGPRFVLTLEEAGPPRPVTLHAGDGRDSELLRDALSPRELEVLELLAEGLDVNAISVRLGLSIHTARNYVKSMLGKLGARTQLQAVVFAIRAGLIDAS